MFNIGPAEMAVLAILAVVVFGPDRLPTLAKQAAQMLRTVREMSTNARKQLSELNPGLDDTLRELDLGQLGKGASRLNARTALQKLMFDDDDDEPAPPVPAPIPTDQVPSVQSPALTMDKAQRVGPVLPQAPTPALDSTDDIT